MLVLETIIEVDWDENYAGVPVFALGGYLYQDYMTGNVDWLPVTGTLPAVTSRFRV